MAANTAYTALPEVRITTLTAAAVSGDSTLTLASTAGITAGDVLLVYQAQGATINTGNTAAYGAVTSLGNAGRFEFVNVISVAGNVVTLSPACSPTLLRFSYNNGSQVIRVPQYSTLTVNAGVVITAPLWNGSTGGVMPILVQNTLTLNGDLSANGAGFRGGVLENDTTDAGTDVSLYRGAASTDGAEKGEGIAGFQAAYDALNGRYGRGAPANGGGGGNAHNGGGGGGANGNNGVAWNGQGNPDRTTAAWDAAWNLDGTLTATTTSSGGGRGGYTYGANNQDALTVAPGNAGWGGNNRRERGGIGGRPLANNPSIAGDTRLFLGGGGGAGDANNSAGSSGARGGGMVIVVAGTISGSGRILANGDTATNSTPNHNDAPGGGGGGGSILASAGTASGVTLRANGGNGGNQLITGNESEGPGGGGGGGYIAASAGLTTAVAAGVNGTTSSGAVTEFIPNGSTRGGSGLAGLAPALASQPICTSSITDLAATKSNGVASVVAGSTTNYTIRITNNGPTPVTGAIITDPAVAGLAKTGIVCSGTPGQCTVGTTPGIAQLQTGYALPALAVGQFYEIVVSATVTASSGSVSNTVSVATPTGTVDSTPGNNSATDTDTILAPQLTIIKTASASPWTVGVAASYTLSV
ncbi:DUF11 domain-containing protein, partial [Dokdonella immobilis]|uniref:DUF11 domain-containing protein n=1 Tax=Dokdonella immobilis TaxID=578942 RepID=UPI001C313B9B